MWVKITSQGKINPGNLGQSSIHHHTVSYSTSNCSLDLKAASIVHHNYPDDYPSEYDLWSSYWSDAVMQITLVLFKGKGLSFKTFIFLLLTLYDISEQITSNEFEFKMHSLIDTRCFHTIMLHTFHDRYMVHNSGYLTKCTSGWWARVFWGVLMSGASLISEVSFFFTSWPHREKLGNSRLALVGDESPNDPPFLPQPFFYWEQLP